MKVHRIVFAVCVYFLMTALINRALCQPLQQSPRKPPNVILIITDDQGYGDMSCHGNPWLKTPHMDKLYKESTRLTDFHVSPTCAPTRAALMTGHYSNRTGVWHTIAGRSLLRESEITMADVFSENGYATGIFGKWHLGDNYPFRPQDRGFQEVLVHGGGGVGQGPDYWNNDYFGDVYLHNGAPVKYKGYCTDIWFENAMKFMEENRQQGRPFFCYLSTNAPHSPYIVHDEYAASYTRNDSIPNAAFNGMISNIDENLGKLLAWLQRKELEENTLLVFMTDNGTSAGVQFKEGKAVKGFNAGMRGQKASMYEGGHRVPCFIRWPGGNIRAGKDVNDLTAHVDILPTIIDLLDLKVSGEITFDGRSIKPVLTGGGVHLPARTLITDSQRLEKPEKWRRSAVMRGPWRLINGTELYNIYDDPGQDRDMARQDPGRVKALRSDYEAWWQDISSVFDEAPAIVLGSSAEPVTVIRTHDMHMDDGYDLVPWNHQQIRDGMKSNGWYAVEAAAEGIYRFSLMRWPPESGAKLLSALPAIPAEKHSSGKGQVPGKSLKLREARLSIDGTVHQQSISQDAGESISFELPVKGGKHELRAWFVDDAGEPFAAYYVKVEKK